MKHLVLALVMVAGPAMAGFLPKIGQHVVTHPAAIICPSKSVLQEIVKTGQESDALKNQGGTQAYALGRRTERLMAYCMTPLHPQKAVIVRRDLADSFYQLRFAPGADYWVWRRDFGVVNGR